MGEGKRLGGPGLCVRREGKMTELERGEEEEEKKDEKKDCFLNEMRAWRREMKNEKN